MKNNPKGLEAALNMRKMFLDGGYKVALYVGFPELLSAIAMLSVRDSSGLYCRNYFFNADGSYYSGSN